jgi:predicted nucleic acid-binding protein
MVLVDTNVILDVATGDPCWSDWSRRQLAHWLDTGPVVINAILYVEIGFPRRPSAGRLPHSTPRSA